MDDRGCLKLADFGGLQRCTEVGKREVDYANRIVTPEFCPPELFKGAHRQVAECYSLVWDGCCCCCVGLRR